jgi:hypothetical protein
VPTCCRLSQHCLDLAGRAQAISTVSALLGQIWPEKNFGQVHSPAHSVFLSHTSTHRLINKTLAGVAQLVERVALITAKRSTSRSWVRAPPSAIPISKLIRAAVLLLFGRPLVACSLPIRETVCSFFLLAQARGRYRQIVTKPPKTHGRRVESQHAKPSSKLHSFVLDFIADLVHHHAYGCHIPTTAAPCLSRLQAETSRSDSRLKVYFAMLCMWLTSET